MTVYERDPYTEAHRRGPGYLFLLCWIAATMVGQAIGASWARPIFNWQPEGVLALLDVEALAGLFLGLFVGTAQALVLLPYLKVTGSLQWVLATILGRIVRVILLSTLTSGLLGIFPETISFDTPGVLCFYFTIHAFIGACAGAATGIAQHFVLRQRVANARWWVWINVGISAYIALVVEIATSFANHQYHLPTGLLYQQPQSPTGLPYIILSSGIPALFTGYVLLDLLRHPTARAEWSLRQRKERRHLQAMADTQISPEALLEQRRSGHP